MNSSPRILPISISATVFPLKLSSGGCATPKLRGGFGRRVSQENSELHSAISLVTGLDSLRKRPPVQPAQIAENRPAWPPA